MDCKLYAKGCGGCPLLGVEYSAQLKQKEDKVRALLGKYGPVRPIRGMEHPWHYRKDRKSTRLNSSHWNKSRMPSSA